MSLIVPRQLRAMEKMLSSFLPFAQEKYGYPETPQIRVAQDPENAKNPLGKTAYYEPESQMITVYVDGRHPKDIMRSISHELVHHHQNVRGDLSGASSVGEQGYAQSDEHLREMEREAYEQGNLCFRDWEDGIKAENPNMYESLQKKNNLKKLQEGEFQTGVPDEDWGNALDTEKYPLQPGELESNKIAAKLEQAWVTAIGWKGLRYVDAEILDLAMAVRDGDISFEEAQEEVLTLREGKKTIKAKLKESQEIDNELEYMSGLYSDIYKAVHGIRPRWARFASAEEVQAAIERLEGDMEAVQIDARAEAEYLEKQKELASLMPDEYDIEYETKPKQSGHGRGLRENMWDKRNRKLNERLMENFGYKAPVVDEGFTYMGRDKDGNLTKRDTADPKKKKKKDDWYDELNSWATKKKKKTDEANEGGEGVHDIFNMPEPEAVEPTGNPKEDALRQIVAQSQAAKVDGVMVDGYTASAIVQVLDAIRPDVKEKYLAAPIHVMAKLALSQVKEGKLKEAQFTPGANIHYEGLKEMLGDYIFDEVSNWHDEAKESLRQEVEVSGFDLTDILMQSLGNDEHVPQQEAFEKHLKARLTEVFKKNPELAKNKLFINALKKGITKITENKS